jgi:uncharacterized membrane protein YfcA
VSLEAWELAACGAVAGALGALLGVGGGVILVPALSLIAGLAFRNAAAVSLVCIVAMSVVSSIVYLGRDRIELEIGLELQFFTVAGAVVAGLIAGIVPQGPLYFAFAALLAYTAWHMAPRRQAIPAADPVAPAAAASRAAVAGASVGAGLLSGLLGVGGGLINTPVLHLMLRVPFERATATSTYMIGLTAAASALIYFSRGDVLPPVAIPTLIGTLIGSSAAAALGHRVRQDFIRYVFVLLIAYVAVEMVRRGIAAS